ncbi:MAG TPA: fumarate hydratase C-terminal domain-containing protein [Candidatus Coproplasma avicola]|uniref:Fumarate hydratase C-terminal domain-containing protein n=1 Tax=Candidatus Coproplasma avicola TaxID=2840744 RepID=A0A9D1J8S1_9FIRM|nr:fumarate hydratase C-terminal domain-containing protein [Candidatus Coproplasma avicola]
MKKLTLPLTSKEVKELHSGDSVLLSGIILTARDCAHRRIKEIMERGEKLPFEIEGAYIYYAGPCPAKPGMASGSCGPTTSARMDSFAPALLDAGLGGMIGKGEMSKEVREAVVRNCKVYFAAIGGAGALYAEAIKKSECIAFPDLLSEAVYRLEVENFPAVVAFDCYGQSIYD